MSFSYEMPWLYVMDGIVSVSVRKESPNLLVIVSNLHWAPIIHLGWAKSSDKLHLILRNHPLDPCQRHPKTLVLLQMVRAVVLHFDWPVFSAETQHDMWQVWCGVPSCYLLSLWKSSNQDTWFWWAKKYKNVMWWD